MQCRVDALSVAEETDHYKIMREFCDDPAGFLEAVIEE
jgi:hypothetical protein